MVSVVGSTGLQIKAKDDVTWLGEESEIGDKARS